MNKIAVLTSGGDSPGMNALLFSLALAAKLNDVTITFIENGYQGLLKNEFKDLSLSTLQSVVFNGGTIIGSSRCLEFKNNKESRILAINNLKKNGVKLLFVAGGNGSYMGAEQIFNLSFPVIAIPATIDNDVASTNYTIGFFSAMEEIVSAIRKLKFTCHSHGQIMLVEVMGRDCPDLTVFAGLSAMVDYIVTKENPKTCAELVDIIRELKNNGKKEVIILCSEKIYGLDHGFNLPSISEVANQIQKSLDISTRATILGHTQRGALPTAWEVYVANGFGKYAFEQFKNNNWNISIGYDGLNFYTTDILESNNIEKNSCKDVILNYNKNFKVIKNN